MPEQVRDKKNEPIREGDMVWTKIRGGKHEGVVDKIVSTKEEAKEESVKHPLQVLFQGRKGKDVAHNPGTLQRREKIEVKKKFRLMSYLLRWTII
ncbi:hypothetical protein F5X99DRAFT_373276 [Biscogniauxia marginata]|nr:hypothetical protein F5X99DRAFT_373276 [Biscogniauxia marginata]